MLMIKTYRLNKTIQIHNAYVSVITCVRSVRLRQIHTIAKAEAAIAMPQRVIDKAIDEWRRRIRPFDWCQNQRPWVTLNGRCALYCRKDAYFGANHKNLNEDSLILSAAKLPKCRPITLLSGDVRMRIFTRFSGEGRQTTVELSITAIFSDVGGYFFGNFREKTSIIIYDT